MLFWMAAGMALKRHEWQINPNGGEISSGLQEIDSFFEDLKKRSAFLSFSLARGIRFQAKVALIDRNRAGTMPIMMEQPARAR
jgi:hypothetical protein